MDYLVDFGEGLSLTEFSLVFEFSSPLTKWRNHDYSWVDTKQQHIANYFSPKVAILKSGIKVVAAQTDGLWLFNPRYSRRLEWIIVHRFLTPLFDYKQDDSPAFRTPLVTLKGVRTFSFLFTRGLVPEFSRSKIPFSAIINFSDHCDFDSPLLLERQRQLFKSKDIIVTKGFFMYHHSKRDYNASYEYSNEELNRWIDDGHELCYHSLSQSTRPKEEEWRRDLEQFANRGLACTTWIDHGFQPYNHSRFSTSGISEKEWTKWMEAAGVSVLWSYLDCGTSGAGMINQIDPEAFSLSAYVKQFRSRPNLSSLASLLRSYILYFGTKKAGKRYTRLVTQLRSKHRNSFMGAVVKLLPGIGFLFWQLIKIVFLSFKQQHSPRWQSFTPVFFQSRVGDRDFMFFQTVELHNFIDTFSESNLNLLINSSGVCMAHTYFADLDRRKEGRIFADASGNLMPGIEDVFSRIATASAKSQLWLARVDELSRQFQSFTHIHYDINEAGEIIHYTDRPELEMIIRYVE